MLRRLGGRLVMALPVAFLLLAALQLVANRVEPANRGMEDQPCPPPESHTLYVARTVLLTIAGRPAETRDWADLCFYRRDNAAVVKSGQRPRIVFLGDSITQYWARQDPQFFSATMLNRGIAGQTSGQVLLRLTPDALSFKPRIVHLLVGLNDVVGARGPLRPEDYRSNIRAMLTLARSAGAYVVIGAIPPARDSGWGTGARPVGRIRELNAWLRETARQEGLVFADYWTAMAAPDGSMRTELADDGVHPNAAGYAVMGPVARAALAQAEQRIGSGLQE